MALTEPVRLLLLSNRKTSLFIALTLTLFLQISAITWVKLPSDPVCGILDENVTLEWNFALSFVNETFDYFMLLRNGNKMMNDKNIFYGSYKGSVELVRSGIPSFVLINLTKNDDGAEYCCEVNTKVGRQGYEDKKCTHLKILVRPTIVSISSNQTLNETDDVTISCNAAGTPSPNVTWSKAPSDKILSSSSFLQLKNISREQDGLYWCTADNGLSKAIASVGVTVQYKARTTYLTSNATNNTVIEGLPVTFQCSARSVPPALLELRFRGALLGNFTDGKFTIQQVKASDQGTYKCVPRNILGIGRIATLNLTVLVRPTIVSISSNQTVNETDDLTLSCNAAGTPSPNVTWSKAPSDKILSSSSFLQLKNIRREQDGLYWCTADNGLSKAIASVGVTVQYKARTTYLTSNATNNTVVEGLPVTFQCSARSVPPALLELRFRGALLGNFRDGKFTIQQVKASDQGTYECVPRNILGIGKTATLKLTVLVPPRIDFVSHNATVNETDDVTLFCNATGNRLPDITWTFLSGPEPREIRIGRSLTLPNVTKRQAGIYQCAAANGDTMNKKTANVHVTINYKPQIKDGSSTKIMSWINHKTEITCEAEGVPVPDITWNHGGLVTSSTEFDSRVSTFTFTPLGSSDFGAYVCTARNLLGLVEKVIAIDMLVEPEEPQILQIDPGLNHLEIHWKASVANPAVPVLDYLVQVKEKGESKRWNNCTQISTLSTSLTCVINDLKSGTMYMVRVAGRNTVGYSEFREKEAQTKTVDEDDYEEMGTFGRQQGLSGYTVDGIVAGVIGFCSLVVVIVAIVTKRRRCNKGNIESNANERSEIECAHGHDNSAFVENPKTDELDEQV